MSKRDKLLDRVCSLSKGLRFEEAAAGIIRSESLDVSQLVRTNQKGLCRNGQTGCGK